MNDVFNRQNLATENTSFKSERGTFIGVILTNKSGTFQTTQNFVTGIGDCEKLFLTVLQSSFEKRRPKIVTYRSCKSFDEKHFFSELESL